MTAKRQTFRPCVETLETRVVLTSSRPSWLPTVGIAATLDPNNTLAVYGASGDDKIKVTQSGGQLSVPNTSIYAVDANANPVWINGIVGWWKTYSTLSDTQVNQLLVNGDTGTDTIDLTGVTKPATVYGAGMDWIAADSSANLSVLANNWARYTNYSTGVRHLDGTITPLSAIYVGFTRPDGSIVTGSGGKVRLDPGTYTARVIGNDNDGTHSTNYDWTQSVTITDVHSYNLLNLQCPVVDFQVAVTHSADNTVTALANALVSFTRQSDGSSAGTHYTDALGRLHCQLSAGTYTVAVQCGNYSWTQTATVANGATVPVSLKHQVVDFQIDTNVAVPANGQVTFTRVDGSSVGTFAVSPTGQFAAVLGGGDYLVTMQNGSHSWTQRVSVNSVYPGLVQLFSADRLLVTLDTNTHTVTVNGTFGTDRIRVTDLDGTLRIFDDARDKVHPVAAFDKATTQIDNLWINCQSSSSNSTIDLAYVLYTPTTVDTGASNATISFFNNLSSVTAVYGSYWRWAQPTEPKPATIAGV